MRHVSFVPIVLSLVVLCTVSGCCSGSSSSEAPPPPAPAPVQPQVPVQPLPLQLQLHSLFLSRPRG